MPEQVFIDSAGLLAILSEDDEHHAKAVTLFAELNRTATRYVTSDFVLGEFLASASRVIIRAEAAITVDQLRRSARVTIVEGTRVLWDRSFDLYKSRPDKQWSLVDCSSMLLCADFNIHRVLTTDHHLEQAGLVRLLR
ncbi:MAG TPA: PIN domain-containing protein [Phycisphaerales bacterium]|nr:PIN domain-containing protein [Phycisphaerales bacterium]